MDLLLPTSTGTAGTGMRYRGVIIKPVAEYSPEDIEEVHKDRKTMNILFNGLDTDMFDNVINCVLPRKSGIPYTLCVKVLSK